VVNAPGPHAADATRVRPVPGTGKSWRQKCVEFVTATS
jgi:hypothetical protein